MHNSLKESVMGILLNENDTDENYVHNIKLMKDILNDRYKGSMVFYDVRKVERISGKDNKCRFILGFNAVHVSNPKFMSNVVADVAKALHNIVFLYNEEGEPLEIVSINVSGRPFDFYSTNGGIRVYIEFEAKIKKHM